MMCEDYPREPPVSSRKYPSAFGSPRSRRTLTKAERSMAFRYDGGDHWVKVTFDSAEAAERAVEMSPIQIYGHWVYAQLYHGKGPERDEAIPLRPEELERCQPGQKHSTLGTPFIPRANSQHENGASSPRSSALGMQNGGDQSHSTSPSSSTATSATATGVEYPDLRHRNTFQDQGIPQTSLLPHNPQMMRHFPDIPRTVLRPASEAFLPQPTWWEQQVKWLTDMGLIPGEIIGNGIPLTEDGRPDLAHASFYWKFFYWIDIHFGTNCCGLKDDE